jgi:hypothetical protein
LVNRNKCLGPVLATPVIFHTLFIWDTVFMCFWYFYAAAVFAMKSFEGEKKLFEINTLKYENERRFK